MSRPIFSNVLILGKIPLHGKYLATAMKRLNNETRVFNCDLSKQPLPSDRFDWSRFDLVLVDASTIPNSIRSWFTLLRPTGCLPPVIIFDRLADVDKAGELYRLGVSDYISLAKINDTRIRLAILNASNHLQQGLEHPARANIKKNQDTVTAKSSPEKTTSPKSAESSTDKEDSAEKKTTETSASRESTASPPPDAAEKSSSENVSEKAARILDSIDTPESDALDSDAEEEDELDEMGDDSVVTPMLQDGEDIPDEEESSSLLDASFVTSGLMSILDRNAVQAAADDSPSSAHHPDPSFITSGLNSILERDTKGSNGGFNWPFTPQDIEAGEAWIDDYQVFEFLSLGLFSTMFKARKKGEDEVRVIKLFKPEVVNHDDTIRFSRGYQLLSEVNDRYIAKIYDQSQHGDWFYIVMEYFPRGDLKARMRKRIDARKVVDYALQISRGLGAAHRHHIIHRALKPTDILFREDKSLALADFGISRQINSDQNLTGEGIIVGKPDYISPEQARGIKLDERSDLYSLGIIMYEMLEGRRPFVGATKLATINGHVNSPVPPMTRKHHGVEVIVERLLEKDRDDRYDSTQSLIADLNACVRVMSG